MSTRAVIDVIKEDTTARVRMTWDGTPGHVLEVVRRLRRAVLSISSARECAEAFVRADCAWHRQCLDKGIRRAANGASRRMLRRYRKAKHSFVVNQEYDAEPLEECTFEDYRFRLTVGERGGCKLEVVMPVGTERG